MPSAKSDQSEQGRHFIEAARELGGDESEEAFREKLRRIAKQRPKEGGQDGKTGVTDADQS